MPGAALAAERLSAFNLALRTNSSEADFTYTGSNRAVHKRRRFGPSMTLSSETTSLDVVHSSFMPEEEGVSGTQWETWQAAERKGLS